MDQRNQTGWSRGIGGRFDDGDPQLIGGGRGVSAGIQVSDNCPRTDAFQAGSEFGNREGGIEWRADTGFRYREESREQPSAVRQGERDDVVRLKAGAQSVRGRGNVLVQCGPGKRCAAGRK